MATIKQIDANRRNAQRSTGPLTAEGKHAASANALKSGIYAETLIIPGERTEDLETLTSEYHGRFHPTTPETRDLVDSVIRHAWLLRRLAAIESASFNCDCPNCANTYKGLSVAAIVSTRTKRNFAHFDAIQRRVNATERNYHRSLKALQDLEALEPPPRAAQPEEPKATSGKLAPFPQKDFLSDRPDSSLDSVEKVESRTSEMPPPPATSQPQLLGNPTLQLPPDPPISAICPTEETKSV